MNAVKAYVFTVKRDSDGSLAAFCSELPGLVATARSWNRLYERTNTAVSTYLERRRREGKAVPGMFEVHLSE